MHRSYAYYVAKSEVHLALTFYFRFSEWGPVLFVTHLSSWMGYIQQFGKIIRLSPHAANLFIRDWRGGGGVYTPSKPSLSSVALDRHVFANDSAAMPGKRASIGGTKGRGRQHLD
jgi:hypothetical protein